MNDTNNDNPAYNMPSVQSRSSSECSASSFDEDELVKELEDAAANLLGGFSSDELPIFPLNSISPTGPSLSTIDHESLASLSPILTTDTEDSTQTPTDSSIIFDSSNSTTDFNCSENNTDDGDCISLSDIHALIGQPESVSPRSGKRIHLDLETIFEGVFLDTPPRKIKKRNSNKNDSSRRSLSNRINRMELEEEQLLDEEEDNCREIKTSANEEDCIEALDSLAIALELK